MGNKIPPRVNATLINSRRLRNGMVIIIPLANGQHPEEAKFNCEYEDDKSVGSLPRGLFNTPLKVREVLHDDATFFTVDASPAVNDYMNQASVIICACRGEDSPGAYDANKNDHYLFPSVLRVPAKTKLRECDCCERPRLATDFLSPEPLCRECLTLSPNGSPMKKES